MNTAIMPDAALICAADDIAAAIGANPRNPKVRTYLDQLDAIAREQCTRQCKRLWRHAIAINGYDRLQVALTHRRHVNVGNIAMARSAAFSLGWLKCHP